jgi:hypothetical protein
MVRHGQVLVGLDRHRHRGQLAGVVSQQGQQLARAADTVSIRSRASTLTGGSDGPIPPPGCPVATVRHP